MPHIFMLTPLLALPSVFLPWQVAVPLYMPFSFGSLPIARKVMQAQRELPASGWEAVIGDQAAVTTVGSQEPEVHYWGKIWRAVSSQPLQTGKQVPIEAVEGLTLRAVPEDRNARIGNRGL